MRSWPECGRLWTLGLAALAEAAVVMPWLLLVRGWASPSEGAGLLGVRALSRVMEAGTAAAAWLLVAFFLAGAMWEWLGSSLSVAGRGWAGAGVLLLVGAAAAALPWWSLPGAVYLWYQGVRQSAVTSDYAEVSSHLGRQGLLQAAAVLIFYAAGAARTAAMEAALVGSVLLLYGSGLGLVAWARQGAVRPQDDGKTAGSSGLLTLLMLLAVAVAAGLAAATLSPGGALGSQVTGALASLWAGVATLLGYLAYPCALLLEYVLVPLFRRIAASEQWAEFLGKPPEGPDQALPELGEPVITPEMLARWGVVLLVAGTAAVAALALLHLRRNGRRVAVGTEEERINLGFWRSLWRDLQDLRLNRRKVGAAGATASRGEAGEPVAPGGARWLYRRLQDWGQQLGRPRRPGETPAAYAEALLAQRPEAAGAVQQVTAVYTEARYSPKPPAHEALEAAHRALELVMEEKESAGR